MTALDYAGVAIAMVIAASVFAWLCGRWMGWWRFKTNGGDRLDRKLGANRQMARHRAAQRRESSMKGRRWPRL